MSAKDIELPSITPREGEGKSESKLGGMREIYDSHIDGPPPITKSMRVEDDDLAFGKANNGEEKSKDETA
jgi:hypothetical protein